MTNGKNKTMSKLEQKWNTMWNQYVREKKLYGFFELKQTMLESFALGIGPLL